jgi:hypothetical protein
VHVVPPAGILRCYLNGDIVAFKLTVGSGFWRRFRGPRASFWSTAWSISTWSRRCSRRCWRGGPGSRSQRLLSSSTIDPRINWLRRFTAFAGCLPRAFTTAEHLSPSAREDDCDRGHQQGQAREQYLRLAYRRAHAGQDRSGPERDEHSGAGAAHHGRDQGGYDPAGRVLVLPSRRVRHSRRWVARCGTGPLRDGCLRPWSGRAPRCRRAGRR